MKLGQIESMRQEDAVRKSYDNGESERNLVTNGPREN